MKLSTIAIAAGALVLAVILTVQTSVNLRTVDHTREAEVQLTTACIYANQGNFVTARSMCIRLLDAKHENRALFNAKVLNVLNQIDIAERNTIRIPTAAEIVSQSRY